MSESESKRKRPGYLKQYAAHAGMALSSASEQLKRVGIDYMQPFDFADADRRREAARHADREAFSKPIKVSGEDEEPVDPETKKDPKFIESQARREMFKAKLIELEYQERVGELILAKDVDDEWFRIARLVRNTMLNIPLRIGAQLAHETDQRKVQDLLEAEIYQALETLCDQISGQEETELVE